MSARLVNVDRNTPMLLPPDLREWVRDDDLVHFVIDALSVLDVSSARLNERGTGNEQYPPSVMLGLPIYCYAQGSFSSRQIERATYQNISVRYLAGNTHPDHDTVAKFRRENAALIRSAFVHLLRLAQASGLLCLGAIALDGTKIAVARRRSHENRAGRLSYRYVWSEITGSVSADRVPQKSIWRSGAGSAAKAVWLGGLNLHWKNGRWRKYKSGRLTL